MTSPKPFCFVLMPFDESFADVYQIGIKESCSSAGAYCERVDEQIFAEEILDRIFNQIAKADFVIADMTGKNPNVFYEVGYAHALGKRTILLTQNSGDIPFDLKHFPHIIYGTSLVQLREQLTKRIAWFISHPETTLATVQDPFQLFVSGKPLGSDELEYYSTPRSSTNIEVVLQNTSPRILRSGDIKIAFISPPAAGSVAHGQDAEITVLPDGSRHHLMRDLTDIFPEQFAAIRLDLYSTMNGEGLPVTVRVYTDQGPRDFRVRAKRG